MTIQTISFHHSSISKLQYKRVFESFIRIIWPSLQSGLFDTRNMLYREKSITNTRVYISRMLDVIDTTKNPPTRKNDYILKHTSCTVPKDC